MFNMQWQLAEEAICLNVDYIATHCVYNYIYQ